MKLSQKLTGAFVSLVLLTLIGGGVGIYNMARINANTEEIATSWLPSVKVLGDMRATANQLRRGEADHLMSSTDAERGAAETRIANAKASLAKLEASYQPLITSPQERALYEDYRKAADAYLAVLDRLLRSSQAGEAQATASRALFRGESRQAFNGVVDQLGKLVDLNDRGSVGAASAAASSYGASRWTMVGLLLVAMVMAAALTLALLRDVLGTLGGEPAEARRLAQAVAQGHLDSEIVVRNGDTTSLMAAIHAMQSGLAQVVAVVRADAESVASASSQIAHGNHDLSQRTEEQASALQQTAASMEELGSTVQQNADNARQADQLAQNASQVATGGGSVVSQVVDTMKGIHESSRRIADIIGVIDGIAFQTNILALNAAVEAARAGEQGTALVDRAGSTMTEVVGSIRRVTDIVGEISAASTEQNSGVAQIGQAVSQMDQTTQQNAALVEEMAAAATSLNLQAQQLVEAVAVFKLAPGQAAATARPAAPSTPRRPPATGISPREADAHGWVHT